MYIWFRRRYDIVDERQGLRIRHSICGVFNLRRTYALLVILIRKWVSYERSRTYTRLITMFSSNAERIFFILPLIITVKLTNQLSSFKHIYR